MKTRRCLPFLLLAPLPFFAAFPAHAQTAISATYARNPQQPVDQDYTAHIKKYTTEPYFNSPLTDYLPASKTVPTPAKVLGDVSGAPGMLPYAEDVYKYFRLLAASSPRASSSLQIRPGRCAPPRRASSGSRSSAERALPK